MCERAAESKPYNLKFVLDHFKTQEICDKAVKDDPSSLQYVLDWFVTRKWVCICYEDSEYYNHDNIFKWYEGL